jgi:hypothetical protein
MKPYEQMTREERQQAEAEWRQSHPSTAEMAMARIFSGGMPEGLPPDQVGNGGQVIRSQLPVGQRERIDREIADCMRGAVDDAIRRPNPMRANTTQGAAVGELSSGGGSATPMGAGRVVGEPRSTGWREGAPLHSSANDTTNAYVDALTHAAFPHGPQHPDYKNRPKKEPT